MGIGAGINMGAGEIMLVVEMGGIVSVVRNGQVCRELLLELVVWVANSLCLPSRL